MLEQNVTNRTEEFRQKKEQLKRRVLEEELRRLESETETRGQELAKMLRSKDELLYKEQLREAQAKRQQEESMLKGQESDIQSRLAEERKKKQARRHEEGRLRREEEESRKQHEELNHQETESRRKADEEGVRLEAEAHQKADVERRRLEEEARKKADTERLRLEQEARKKAEEQRVKLESEAHRKADERRRQFEEEARKRAEEERQRQEEQLRLQREEFVRKEEERRRKEEQRRLEAEQRHLEEEEHRKLAEEQRIKDEEERHRKQEVEERLKKEEELRLEIEERQRQEAEAAQRRSEELQRQKEEQIRKEKAEKVERILELVANAQALYGSGDLKAALVEVAKALVNDPKHRGALHLEQTIKQQLEIAEPKKEAPPAPIPAERKHQKKKAKAPAPKVEALPPKKLNYSKYLMAAAIVAVVLAAAVLFFRYQDQLFPKNISFAIVPWASTANIPEETIIGSSLAEEVAKQFERQKKPMMMGYASSYGLSIAMKDPFRAIITLGFPYVLQGSVTKSAVGYNVSVRLVDSVGWVYWSQSFIKSEASLPGLPLEIAAQLARAVGLPSPKDGGGVSAGVTTSNISAYAIYLRGLELMHRQTKESVRNAVSIFKQAIELDENFSSALAAAASGLVMLAEEGWDQDDSVLAQAKAYGEKAIRANTMMSSGYAALARISGLRKDYRSAFDRVQTGLKYAPNNSDLHLEKARLLIIWGREKEAIDELTTAYTLDPRDPRILRTFGYAYQISGLAQQASWYHQSAVYFVNDSTAYIAGPLTDALMVDPNFSLRESRRLGDAFERRIHADPKSYRDLYRYARMLQVIGKHPEGTAMLERTEKILRTELQVHPKNSDALMVLGLTLTRLGKFAEATLLARKAADVDKDNPSIKYKIAQMLSLQMFSAQRKKTDEKKKEEALRTLREAVRLTYNFEELSNADFFNMYQLPEYHAAIQIAGQ